MTFWILRGLFAALALVAIGAQLDRASYLRPELSVIVPAPFRSFAQPTTALLALAREDGAAAAAEARRLVRRRPMPAEHLFTLAMSEMRGARPAAFAKAFRLASTRGWRYPPLQVTAAQAALASGDVPGAANRVAALWAEDPDNPSVAPLTAALLEAPGGVEAFATPLGQTRVWSSNFLRRGPGVAAPADVLATIIAARRGGARFECAALRGAERSLTARGQRVPRGALSCD